MKMRIKAAGEWKFNQQKQEQNQAYILQGNIRKYLKVIHVKYNIIAFNIYTSFSSYIGWNQYKSESKAHRCSEL